jgi:hypothetical protein
MVSIHQHRFYLKHITKLRTLFIAPKCQSRCTFSLHWSAVLLCHLSSCHSKYVDNIYPVDATPDILSGSVQLHVHEDYITGSSFVCASELVRAILPRFFGCLEKREC